MRGKGRELCCCLIVQSRVVAVCPDSKTALLPSPLSFACFVGARVSTAKRRCSYDVHLAGRGLGLGQRVHQLRRKPEQERVGYDTLNVCGLDISLTQFQTFPRLLLLLSSNRPITILTRCVRWPNASAFMQVGYRRINQRISFDFLLRTHMPTSDL